MAMFPYSSRFPVRIVTVSAWLNQVLTHKDKLFLRIANDRGWTYAKNPSNDSTLFEEINGDVAEDK